MRRVLGVQTKCRRPPHAQCFIVLRSDDSYLHTHAFPFVVLLVRLRRRVAATHARLFLAAGAAAPAAAAAVTAAIPKHRLVVVLATTAAAESGDNPQKVLSEPDNVILHARSFGIDLQGQPLPTTFYSTPLSQPPAPAPVALESPDGDFDTVVLEAPAEASTPLMLVRAGGGRGVIGAIIGGVPWLPLEFNVPDAVRWLWALLAGGGNGVRYQTSQYMYRP
ncbi:hypothetical protein EVAR_43597_1 [Eumeta japonica]|uniref:Uncharacterized protein n=1 Tax=Eumeta variegata TaxID=151549 RepID=A0A4C1XEZ8_EUMVA|nr:hypothetical protein EVAR_43597_1 [Eumeta japonica]